MPVTSIPIDESMSPIQGSPDIHSSPKTIHRVIRQPVIGKDAIQDAVRTRYKYSVSIPEVWNRGVCVDAISEQDAIDKVRDGIRSGSIECAGTEGLEFGYDMDSSYWSATPLS